MHDTVASAAASCPPVLAENTRPQMAKASLRKAENTLGRAIYRAMGLCGWSLKELAGAVDRNPRQVARWIDGTERAQVELLFALTPFRKPLIQALAELAGDGVEVETTIRIFKRTA